MVLNFDQELIDFACPKCAHQFHERFGRLKNVTNITCPRCHNRLSLDSDIPQALKAIRDSLARLSRK